MPISPPRCFGSRPIGPERLRKESGELLAAQDLGKLRRGAGGGDGEARGRTPQRHLVEEAKGGNDLVAGAGAQALLLVQVHEEASDLALGQAIGRAPVEQRELGDGTDGCGLGVLGEASNPHVLDHLLAKRCHVDLPGRGRHGRRARRSAHLRSFWTGWARASLCGARHRKDFAQRQNAGASHSSPAASAASFKRSL
jgi:hypothetical protein